MVLPDTFMGYLVIFMILAMPIALLIFGLAVSNVGLKAADEWIKQREAKSGAAGTPDAAGAPAAG